MAKKATAAFLLLAITAWAEMAMAPMLAMHAVHMHPGHEMTADMPVHHMHRHMEHAQSANERACCPGLRKVEPDVSEVEASAPACDNPHSCCFRQGPQSVPAPASDGQSLARALTPAGAAAYRAVAAQEHVVEGKLLTLRLPPDLYGMTLRI